MSEKILDGMAQYGLWRVDPESYSILCEEYKAKYREDCRAALLWLADNVSEEMMFVFYNATVTNGLIKTGIAEALRKAGEEGK